MLRGVHLLRFVECYEVCSRLRLSVSLQQQLPGKYWLRSLHCGLEEFIPASQIFQGFYQYCIFKTYSDVMALINIANFKRFRDAEVFIKICNFRHLAGLSFF
jgi:hypothetical protein